MIALACLALVACGGRSAPVTLQLGDLVRFARTFDGQVVATQGVVHRFRERKHYWIEDGQAHRVGVRPASAVASRSGQEVRVVGRFHYTTGEGRWIEVREVRVAADPASAP